MTLLPGCRRVTEEADRAIREFRLAPAGERGLLRDLASRLGLNVSTVSGHLYRQRLEETKIVGAKRVRPDSLRKKALFVSSGKLEEPDPEAVRKRDELDRMLLTARLSFGQQFFGDPLPTRSALEQRGQEMRT